MRPGMTFIEDLYVFGGARHSCASVGRISSRSGIESTEVLSQLRIVFDSMSMPHCCNVSLQLPRMVMMFVDSPGHLQRT